MSSAGQMYQSNKNQMGITGSALSSQLGLGAGDDLQTQLEDEVQQRKKLQQSQPGFKNQQGVSATQALMSNLGIGM